MCGMDCTKPYKIRLRVKLAIIDSPHIYIYSYIVACQYVCMLYYAHYKYPYLYLGHPEFLLIWVKGSFSPC